MKPRTVAWTLFLSAAAALALLLGMSVARGRQRNAMLAREQTRHQVLLALQGENARLKALQPSAAELARLEAVKQESERLQQELTRAKPVEPAESKNTPYGLGETLAARDWSYSGRLDPKSTLESVLWAASRGELDPLAGLLGFTPDVRERADALFAQLPLVSQQEYGSPERVLATLIAGSFPKDASAMTVLGGGEWPDAAAAAISARVDHSDGISRINVYQLQHVQDGWQLVVPEEVLSGYMSTVAGPPAPSP